MGFKINKKNTSHQKYSSTLQVSSWLALLTRLLYRLANIKKNQKKKSAKGQGKESPFLTNKVSFPPAFFLNVFTLSSASINKI